MTIAVVDLPVALRRLRRIEPAFGPLIRKVGPIELDVDPMVNAFESLTKAIVYQQLTGKAAATIFGRFKALYSGARFPLPERVCATDARKLRKVGLSRAKAAAVKDLAQKVIDGTVPSVSALKRMNDDEIVERLTQVRGIGPWSAQMLLIFRLGRPDVLPIGDYGVRKGYAIAFSKRALPTPRALEAHGEAWAPYRTTASLLLWRAVDVTRK